MSAKTRGHGKTVLVPDDATILRASDLMRLANDKSLRELAKEIGVPHSTIHRFLRENGFQPVTSWRRTP